MNGLTKVKVFGGIVLALTAQACFAADAPPFPDVAATAIKTAFPGATVGTALRNIDRGIEVYYVTLTGDKTVSTAEVTPTGTLVQDCLKVDEKDLPAVVDKAATDAAAGAKFADAVKLDIRTEFLPKTGPLSAKRTLTPLKENVTAYDVTFTKDGINGVVRLDSDGNVIDEINWMKKAAADVPPGKLVIRMNEGCTIDYTDRSGVVWAAEQKYTKESGFGYLDGRVSQRIGLIVRGTDAPSVYDSERDKEGAFQADVPNGTYTVRIHMCESWEGARKPDLRDFGIKIQGKVVVPKMDIINEAGDWLIPLVKEFKDIPVTEGKIVIQPFAANNRDQHPCVDAYEIIQQ